MPGRILVLAANGNVGGPLVRALLAMGEDVRAATRSGAPVAGAPGVACDLDQPSSLVAALEGVDRLFALAPTGTLEVTARLLPLVEAAAARHIKVVLMTALGVDADEAIPYRQVERALERSGTPFVILRPNWFADNFHTFWKAGIDRGQVAVPAAQGQTSFIDARDIAQCAAVALTTDRFDGRAFNLTGPQALDYGAAAAILAQVTGKSIAYTPLTDAAFIGLLTGAGMPEAYAQFMAWLFHPVREGWTARVTGDVETLTGEAPRTLETYARDNAARLA